MTGGLELWGFGSSESWLWTVDRRFLIVGEASGDVALSGPPWPVESTSVVEQHQTKLDDASWHQRKLNDTGSNALCDSQMTLRVVERSSMILYDVERCSMITRKKSQLDHWLNRGSTIGLAGGSTAGRFWVYLSVIANIILNMAKLGSSKYSSSIFHFVEHLVCLLVISYLLLSFTSSFFSFFLRFSFPLLVPSHCWGSNPQPRLDRPKN